MVLADTAMTPKSLRHHVQQRATVYSINSTGGCELLSIEHSYVAVTAARLVMLIVKCGWPDSTD
jgi:hypothetical protein